MAALLYQIFVFFTLFSYGIFHLISATRSFFNPTSPTSSSSRVSDHFARPFYPIFLTSKLRNLPLYLISLSLLISISHHTFLSSNFNFSSLQTAASLFFFLLISISLFLPLSLPPGLVFLLAAIGFGLLASVSSAYQHSDLQSKCDSMASVVFASSAVFSLAIAVSPRLFVAEFALAASVSLQGIWSLQTVLSIHVERLIPEGCHRLLEVRDGSVRCELEDSRNRASAILDLAFILHTAFICVVFVVIYAVIGGFPRQYNGGSYEALPTSLSGGVNDLDHVQMKAITKHSTQA